MARDYENYSKDALIAHIYELEKQLKNNKYGLYWDKSIEQEAAVIQCKNNIPVLKRESDKCIMDYPDADTHILIEGDNYHALTAMNMMCGTEGFVDVIYIDPPYNTGNEDFIYNDRYIDIEDGYRHSKWLSFMDKRLRIARRLLKHNGLIFISIDDREMGNLRLLCDSIFGERNFIANFSWMKTATASFLAKTVRNKMEYVLCYKKHELDYIINGGVTEGGDAPLLNAANRIRTALFPKDAIRFNLPDGVYEAGEKDSLKLEKTITIIDGAPTDDVELTGKFKWSQETINEEINKGTTFIVKSNKFSIRFLRTEQKTKIPSNLISREECNVGTNEEGAKIIKDIFGESVFDYAKPVSLIKYLINMNPNKNAVVMDFFVGSGTTAQAVLELNEEDNGKRQFVAVTDNENSICTEITYPRIKTAITGDRPDGTKYRNGIPANLMYYKTDFIKDSHDTDQARYCLVEKVDELLCIVEGTYVAKERTDYYSHYEAMSGNKHTFIYSEYYNESQFEEFINHINAASGEKIVYMFSTDNTIDPRLSGGMNNVIVKPIPSKIYEIYKEIVEDIKRGEQ